MQASHSTSSVIVQWNWPKESKAPKPLSFKKKKKEKTYCFVQVIMTEIEALALSTELPLLMGLSVGYRSPEGKAATKRTTTPGSMKSLAFSG